MVIGRAALLVDPTTWSESVTVCRSLAELDAVHRRDDECDVAVPPLTIPDIDRPMFVFDVDGRLIATNGMHAFCVVRAVRSVQLAGAALDRTALLAEHRDVRSLERAVLVRGLAAIGDDAAARWAARCREPIEERHRRLSLLRAELLSTIASTGIDGTAVQAINKIDAIIEGESRKAWA